MTTTNSDLYGKQVLGKAPLAVPAGLTKQVRRSFCTATLGSGLAAADIVNLFKLPKGAKIVDFWIYCTDIDTNVSPTVKWDVGDADGAATIFSQSTVGQSAGYDRSPVIGAIDKQYTVETLIFATVHTVAATKAAGTLYAMCEYTHDGISTS